jgi:hypothetical protein
MKYKYDIYMLCPVRKATKEEKQFLEEYKGELESRGFKVHYPATDTIQEDETGGYRICMDHCKEIGESEAVHTYWNGDSTGSYVDLGTSLFEHYKRGLDIILMKRGSVEEIVKKQKEGNILKSYERVLLHLDDIANSRTRIR